MNDRLSKEVISHIDKAWKDSLHPVSGQMDMRLKKLEDDFVQTWNSPGGGDHDRNEFRTQRPKRKGDENVSPSSDAIHLNYLDVEKLDAAFKASERIYAKGGVAFDLSGILIINYCVIARFNLPFIL